MSQRIKTHSKPRRRQRARINPSFIVLGAVLLIIVAIAAMIVLSQEDEPKILVVPSSHWMPQHPNFTPEFTLAGLDNSQVSLSDYRGKYVLLNFWATWCPPCRAEMPDLQTSYNAHQNQNFTLVAINVGESTATAQGFMEAHEFAFPVALDEFSVVHSSYGEPSNGSLPISFLIDPAGRLIKAWKPGALDRATLEQDITPLLKG